MNIMTIKAIDTATEAIGGRVGIGTANPTEALHVVGEIYAHDGDVCQRSPIPPNEITCLSSVRAFGVWNDRNKNGSPNTVAFNTTYLAQTDGFVCALLIITSGDGLGYLRGYTDSSNPPTTARAWTNEEQEETGRIQESITFPVRKGDYWKVDMYAPGSGTKKVYWMPIGN
ncbi:hypothetical protein AMJ47_01655 [Parcubacteria bacterium DG_72]|nr:MAG: hypothetical protein AMJ47_01655 [Parcubacteria bacterium DG_72]